MNFRVHSLLFGAVGLVYGIADILVPNLVLRVNAMADGAAAAAPVRFAGCLCVAWGLAGLLARDTVDRTAQRALLASGVVYALTATAVTAYSFSEDVAGASAWSILLITVPFGGNATRLLLKLRSVGTNPSPA